MTQPRWRRLQCGVRSCGLAAALLMAATVALTPATDADDWQPITPEELKMTAEPKAPGAAAINLYRQVDRDRFQPRGA